MSQREEDEARAARARAAAAADLGEERASMLDELSKLVNRWGEEQQRPPVQIIDVLIATLAATLHEWSYDKTEAVNETCRRLQVMVAYAEKRARLD